MSRKTIKVKDLLEQVNKMLASDHEDMMVLKDLTPAQAMRLGMAHVLESVLHETGNYGGYSHQSGAVDYGPADQSVCEYPKILDDTRRKYGYTIKMMRDMGL